MIETLDITAEEKDKLRRLAKRLGLEGSSTSRQEPRYPGVAEGEEERRAFARYLILEQRRREAQGNG